MWKKLGRGLLIIVISLGVIAWLSYRPLPARENLAWKNIVKPEGKSTPFSSLITSMTEEHPSLSGVKPLSTGREAFAMRAVLAATAGQTIDAQYYIWHNDTAGKLLFSALLDAANRGVRVRLLLDDNNTRQMDTLLATLNANPMIEVRLFNPFMHREFRPLGYLNDFFRLNRRMHNKSFTVDNVATIVGGRNIGDEYFEVGDGVMFADLDVIAVGKVVNDVQEDFERYWQSASVYPFAAIAPDAKPNPATLADAKTTTEAKQYLQEIAKTNIIHYLREDKTLPLVWAPVHLVSDDPAKGLGAAREGKTVSEKLTASIGEVQQRLVLVSPYFVPTKAGTQALTQLVQNGKQVEVLTNSLSATDVAAVHAGYAKYRKPLLEGGVKLYELKSGSTIHAAKDTGLTGHSGSSLHAKTFAIDDERLFIGSFNLDPRSINLNTEMGFLIDSPELTQNITAALTQKLLEHVYQVRLNQTGQLMWLSKENGEEKTTFAEPKSSAWRRFQVNALAFLPIEWLL